MPTHSAAFNRKLCDLVLDWLDKTPNGEIYLEDLSKAFSEHGGPPPDYDEVIAFLVKENLLEQDRYRLKITYAGRIKIHQGGFRKAYSRERWMRICTVVAAIAGVLAVILQVLFQFLR